MRGARLVRVSMLLGALIGASWELGAQLYSVTVTGLVTDPNGAAVPDAKVLVRNTNTQEVRQTLTSSEGHYTLPNLLPGSYELTVETTGFRRFVRTGIRLEGSQHAQIDVALRLGEVTETVEVTAQGITLDTQSANQTSTLTEREIQELPLNFRSPLQLVFTNAGVTSTVVRSGLNTFHDRVRDHDAGQFAMNGGREATAGIQIDGLNARAADWGSTYAIPSVESVQEIQISRNTYDAEYDRTGSGFVSVVTRGGSGEFHGSLYNFLRNDNLDANQWDRNKNGAKRAEFKRNQFGGNVSGPVWKRRRLFFLFGYEGMRVPSEADATATVPTLLQRNGDFSETRNSNGSLKAIFDPFSTAPNASGAGFTRTAFPGNVIPRSRFDPVGFNIVTMLYPEPNRPGLPVTQANNFFGSGASTQNIDRFDGRLDWARSEKHTAFFRITRTMLEEGGSRVFNTLGDPGNDNNYPFYQLTFSNTFVPNPSWVVNALAGAGGAVRHSLAFTEGSVGLTALGFPQALESQVQGNNIGQYALQEYAGVGRWRSFFNSRRTNSAKVNVSHVRSNHTIKFGFTAEALIHNIREAFTLNLGFNPGMTSGPVAATNSATSGNSVASALLGTGVNGSSRSAISPAATQIYYGWYAQDAWRITNRLTATLGLRYELARPRTERYDRQNYFDYDVANPLGRAVGLPLTGGLEFNGPGNRFQTAQDFTDFAPRIGLAYRPTNKLVIRSGYGISYSRPVTDSAPTGNDGFSVDTVWVASLDGLTPRNVARNPFPDGLDRPTGNAEGLLTRVGTTIIGAYRRDNPTPYLQSYSFDLQYLVNPHAVVEFGYTGNLGRKLPYGLVVDFNQMPPQFLSLGAALNESVANPFFGHIASGPLSARTIPRHRLLRPNPQFATISATPSEKGAYSRFNALYAKFNQRLSKGLTVSASYQLSKAKDNASEDQGSFANDQFRSIYNPGAEYSVSSHDIPQDFLARFVYELPLGRGGAAGASTRSFSQAILGGWQVSGVFRLSSGAPISLFAPNTLSVYGFGVQRPNIANESALRLDNPTPDRWFDTSAVSVPGTFEIGNARRVLDSVRMDGINNLDVSVAKRFDLTERWKLQFRTEFFNLTNTPVFGLTTGGPQVTAGSGAFGAVTSAYMTGPRQIQFGLKLTY